MTTSVLGKYSAEGERIHIKKSIKVFRSLDPFYIGVGGWWYLEIFAIFSSNFK